MWGMQESIIVLLLDVEPLKNPVAHDLHLGWEMAEPTVCVYVPGGHLLCAEQKSILMLLVDVVPLKSPTAHRAHSGWVVTVPAVLVYFAAGHLM